MGEKPPVLSRKKEYHSSMTSDVVREEGDGETATA
jgi:hypothetical protein